MKISENFTVQEFVPPSIFNRFGEHSIQFIDYRLPGVVEAIRELVGKPIIINNWNNGGDKDDSGYRVPDCKEGAELSQHKFGRAADLKVTNMNYEDFRNLIRSNFPKLNALGLTTIELGTLTWLHVDLRWTGLSTLNEVPYFTKK